MSSDPPDGKVPYTPWALAKRNEIRAGLARGWPGETGHVCSTAIRTALCLVGMPRTLVWRAGDRAEAGLRDPADAQLLTA